MSDAAGVAEPVAVVGESAEAATPTSSTNNDADDVFTWDIQRTFINVFIVFHLTAIIFWNLPYTPLQVGVNAFNADYMSLTGNWQCWSMFSPDPSSVNTYLTAKIYYKDNSVRNYIFPRISKLGAISKYRQERWRKFLENTADDSHSAYFPYLARYAAIVNNYSPKVNPVVSVDLIRYDQYIPAPGNPITGYTSKRILREFVNAMPSRMSLYSLGTGQ